MRTRAGISQEALADMLGIRRSNYVGIETGRRPVPKGLEEKLASIPELRVSLETLKGWRAAEDYQGPELVEALNTLEWGDLIEAARQGKVPGHVIAELLKAVDPDRVLNAASEVRPGVVAEIKAQEEKE